MSTDGHEENNDSQSSQKLSKEEIRLRRLQKLDSTASHDDATDEATDLEAALRLSLQSETQDPSNESPSPAVSIINNSSSNTETFHLSSFLQIMWDSTMTTENDKLRWVQQGIDVRRNDTPTLSPVDKPLETLVQSHLPWGLLQQHGGPCGVLAAVQAELLKYLLYETEKEAVLSNIDKGLARSIAVILARVTLTPSVVAPDQPRPGQVRVVLPTSTNWQAQLLEISPTSTLQVHCIPDGQSRKRQKLQSNNESLQSQVQQLADQVQAFILSQEMYLSYFQEPGGVLLLVMSIVESRRLATVQAEFDDQAGTRLTAQFGHCGQELMNLLLTGQAVSNVFDNSMSPSGDMVCRGIQYRPTIGYLSQLEAMRYCEVGGYYKSPLYPIWVVGSTSHFTVLFGDRDALQESSSDLLLEECRRAFKSVDGGENGFIKVENLGDVLQKLKIALGTDGDETARVQTLAASLEVSGAGIILWNDCWKVCSRLRTGATLESILQGGDGTESSKAIIVEPLFDDLDAKPPAAANTDFETDEEMARRLQAEWDGGDTSGMDALSSAAAAAKPMEVELTDEQLARKLQEQFNAEAGSGGDGGDSSVVALDGGSTRTSVNDLPPLVGVDIAVDVGAKDDLDQKPAAKDMEFEQFGDTFALYHYNGLRGGVLTPLRITRLTPEEAVGANIALNQGSGGASANGSSLEDVVRTKWPSCSIDWMGKQPPFID